MAINVTRVTPAVIAQIDAHYPVLAANFRAQWKCSLTGPDLPDKQWLKACVTESPPKHAVAIATDSGVIVGLAVVHLPSQRIVWLVPNGNYAGGVPAVATALCNFVKAQVGVARGTVENPNVRNAWAAADNKFAQGPDSALEWRG